MKYSIQDITRKYTIMLSDQKKQISKAVGLNITNKSDAHQWFRVESGTCWSQLQRSTFEPVPQCCR